MFTVGEFALLAQVSKRLLRYYDEIDLLKPDHISSGGYRYYTAEQMRHLNQILALKELGFSLEEIQDCLHDNITGAELQTLLHAKKAETERQVQAELQRLRKIEARLQTINQPTPPQPQSFIVKEVPSTQATLRLRETVADFPQSIWLFNQIQDAFAKNRQKGMLYCQCYSDLYVEHDLDLEIGFVGGRVPQEAFKLSRDFVLYPDQQTTGGLIASTVIKGDLDAIHRGYVDLETWVDQSGYAIVGPPRELCLQIPTNAHESDVIVEIQIPIASRSINIPVPAFS